jgi:hypothetical protein
MRQLDQLLQHSYSSSFADAFREFATWNLYNGTAVDAGVSYADSAAYSKPAMTTEVAPFIATNPLRVYYASTQYFLVHYAGRDQMVAVLGGDTTGLMLVLATRRGGIIDSVQVASDVTRWTISDTSNNADFIVAVVNGAHEGSNGALSVRPTICIGAPSECAIEPPDAGSDGGMITLPTPPDLTPPAKTGCGCNASGAPLLLLALAGLTRRARRGAGH